jgi:hypothetical protein
MNPYPFFVSNHFTTPFAAKIVALLFETVFTLLRRKPRLHAGKDLKMRGGYPSKCVWSSWGVLRRVPLAPAQAPERRRSFEAHGKAIGFSPQGSTAAFDITNQFPCQEFYLPHKPPFPWREGLSAETGIETSGIQSFLAAR